MISAAISERLKPMNTAVRAQEPQELSVVLPCLNEAETLKACLVQARQTMSAAGIRGEIIVADNGSTDGTGGVAERLAQTMPNVRLISHERNLGFGKAYQTALAAARMTSAFSVSAMVALLISMR